MRGVGHFRGDAARAHFLEAYDAGMAALPTVAATVDVPTSFGSVRVYRIDGPSDATPVVLLPGRNASTPVWRANLPDLMGTRTVYCVDSLAKPGFRCRRDRWRVPTTRLGGSTRHWLVSTWPGCI